MTKKTIQQLEVVIAEYDQHMRQAQRIMRRIKAELKKVKAEKADATKSARTRRR